MTHRTVQGEGCTSLGGQVRVTGPGWLNLGLVAGMAGAAANAGFNLVFLLTAFLLAGLAFNAVFVWLMMRGLKAGLHHPSSAYAGSSYPVSLWLLPGMGLVRIFRPVYQVKLAYTKQHFKKRHDLKRLFPLAEAGLGLLWPEQDAVSKTVEERGLSHWIILEVAADYPFGLWQIRRWYSCPWEFSVYPRLVPVPNKALLAPSRQESYATDSHGTRGDGILPFGNRPYTFGDSFKKVNWKLTARHRELVIIETERGENRALLLFLAPPECYPGHPATQKVQFERSLSAAASLLSAPVTPGGFFELVGYYPDFKRIKALAHSTQIERVMRAFAATDFPESSGLERFRQILSQFRQPRTSLYFIGPDRDACLHFRSAMGASGSAGTGIWLSDSGDRVVFETEYHFLGTKTTSKEFKSPPVAGVVS